MLTGGRAQKSSRHLAGSSVDSASVDTVPDSLESVLAGLNEAQREACLALRGPVAILAGAGTGKTTTITHRIACQVRSYAFQPSQILAVDLHPHKADGELRTRLKALCVEGVEARTASRAATTPVTTRKPSEPSRPSKQSRSGAARCASG
jgi:DNA helicase II / ATP-dependent DNA helicase PcrA